MIVPPVSVSLRLIPLLNVAATKSASCTLLSPPQMFVVGSQEIYFYLSMTILAFQDHYLEQQSLVHRG